MDTELTNLCPVETVDPLWPWEHFCTHPPNHNGQHDCLCGYTWRNS